MRAAADPVAAQRAALEGAFATGRPYAGLRGYERDAALDAVVPPALARRLRLVPLALDGGVLRVAVADPQADAEALSARLGGRPVAIALASAAEIDEVLGPARASRRLPRPLLAVAALLAALLTAAAVLAARGDDGHRAERAGKSVPVVADPARSAEQPPQPQQRPLTVAVAGGALPRALREAWPSDAVANPASSRADALAALCTGAADVAVLAAPPTGAERADAGCALATTAEVTVAATVLLARRGGCVRARAAVRRGRRGKRPVRRLAVRDARGRCVRPTPANIRSGDYPLTRRVAIVAGPSGAPATTGVRPRLTTATVRREKLS